MTRTIRNTVYPDNKSKQWFAKISYCAYLTGLPNFWIEDLELSDNFMRIYDRFAKIFSATAILFVLLQLLSVFTQHELTEKQQYMQILFGVGHPFLCTYSLIMTYYKDKTRAVLLEITVRLKQIHNDLEIERHMLKQCKMYVILFSSACYSSIFSYFVDSFIQTMKTGVPFNVVIAVWPIVDDKSFMAYLARFFYHIVWVMFISQVVCVYILVLSLNSCISHQYKHLQNYFEGLNEVFKEHLNQNEKEDKYAMKFKVGVQAHSDTLKVTKEIHAISNHVVSGQIVFCIIMITILLYQTFVLNKERSLGKTISASITALTILSSTGFFMWNAGDVTYEASYVGTSMYASGWQNCHGASSIRIRKLLVVAMNQAQIPVVMKGLGIIELSHQSFLSIVKCSYSLFSLLY